MVKRQPLSKQLNLRLPVQPLIVVASHSVTTGYSRSQHVPYHRCILPLYCLVQSRFAETLTLTLTPNFGESGFGESGRQPLFWALSFDLEPEMSLGRNFSTRTDPMHSCTEYQFTEILDTFQQTAYRPKSKHIRITECFPGLSVARITYTVLVE